MKSKPSKLDAFAERLDEWFGIEKKTLSEVQEQLKLDGCVVSLSRLSDWWAARQSQLMQERLLAQISSGARQCKEVEKEFGNSPPPELETLIKLHRVLILKLSTAAVADPEILSMASQMMKPIIAFAKVQESAESRKLDERKLALMEAKAVQADKAKGVLENVDLSEDQKSARMRELFGIA